MTKAPATAQEAEKQRQQTGEGCSRCAMFVVAAIAIGGLFAFLMTLGS